MTTTSMNIPYEVFNFSGQTYLETWCLRETISDIDLGQYSEWLCEEIPLYMQRIKDLADSFPFWQRRKWTGRPPTRERDLLIGFLLRTLFDSTFRQTTALMRIFSDYFEFKLVPHPTVLSRKNQSKRWFRIWKRFHKYVMKLLPKRKSEVATDATGFSGCKQSWKETPYDHRPNQSWVKLHASIEIASLLILNYSLTGSDVHESQEFEGLWKGLPGNVEPVRSMADNSYTGEKCLQAVRNHGAIPFHNVRKDAKYVHKPRTAYDKLVYFARHWAKKFKEIYGKRNQVETVFSMIGMRFGYRIRCREKTARKNEVQAKINAHNIRALACKEFMCGFLV